MSAVLPKPTARRIDRLARHAHAFHRFAHHPLCQRYAAELIPLGRRTRVCRGCASAAVGALSGATAALLTRPSSSTVLVGAALALVVLFGSLAVRLPKSVGRALGMALASFAALGGLLCAERGPRLVAAGLCACGVAFLWLYRRRGPNRSPCQTCSERLAAGTCSGFRPIVQRERAFRRLAQRYIDAALASR
jgi:hypothetical protein